MASAAASAIVQSRTKRLIAKGGKLYQFGQPSTKKFGTKGLQVPIPQQLRIVKKYIRGTSIRQIAEEEDRARQTVTKIVRAREVQDYVQKLREEVIALGDEMLRSVRFALRNELEGRLVYAMLKDIGVIQSCATVQGTNQHQSTEVNS